jgi:coenzyme F420-reducing hydrogenase alpha subunit
VISMERMSDKERDKLRELQAKAKRVERAEKEFFANVQERREEVLKFLNADVMSDEERAAYDEECRILDRLYDIADRYGVDVNELLNYIGSDQQVNYYRNTHGQTTAQQGGFGNIWKK